MDHIPRIAGFGRPDNYDAPVTSDAIIIPVPEFQTLVDHLKLDFDIQIYHFIHLISHLDDYDIINPQQFQLPVDNIVHVYQQQVTDPYFHNSGVFRNSMKMEVFHQLKTNVSAYTVPTDLGANVGIEGYVQLLLP